MFIWYLLIISVVNGKNVSLFNVGELIESSDWKTNCQAKGNVNLINTTTNWTTVQPYYSALPSYSLIVSVCTIKSGPPKTKHQILNNCIIKLQSASTKPTSFNGMVSWQGRTTELNPPNTIYSNASKEILYTEWQANIGNYNADNESFLITFDVQQLANTEWIVTKYVQVICDVPMDETKLALIIILSVACALILFVIISTCIIKKNLSNAKEYFALTRQHERKKYCFKWLCCGKKRQYSKL